MNTQTTSPVLTLRKAGDLVAESVSWTVDQIIPAGMLTVLSGKDKTGKTLMGWEIARAVTRGAPFLGHFPVESGAVVFLALDDPAVVIVERLDTLSLSDAPDLHVATPLDCKHTHQSFLREVERQVTQIGARLLIVDSLYLFLPSGHEALNQAGAMGPLMQNINGIAERTGASTLLITHDTKSGGDVAGSFVVRAAAKQIIRLCKDEHESTRRLLQVEGKLIERCDWTLEFKGPGAWALVDEEAEKFATTKALVRDWLKGGNQGTAETIACAVGKRRADVDTVVRQLLADGIVKVEPVSKGRGRPCQVYSRNFSPDQATA